MLLALSRQEVEQTVEMGEVITTLKEAFKAYSKGETIVPLRTPIHCKEQKGDILFMPGLIPSSNAVGLKIVSVFPENKAKGKPTIHGMVVLNDVESGEPMAIMDGEHLTALRTGGATGVAADLLARKDAKIVALFGIGHQGMFQLDAVINVRTIEKIYLYHRDIKRASDYANKIRKKQGYENISFIPVNNQKEAVENADIIIGATTAKEPVIEGKYIKEGTFISGVGSYRPDMQEFGLDTLKICSKIVIDSREAALKEAGDIAIPIKNLQLTEDDILGEIGEVLMGKIPARENEKEIIFFKSVGIAVQDMAIGKLIYDRALEKELGTKIDLF